MRCRLSALVSPAVPPSVPPSDPGYDRLAPRLIPGYASLARLAVALLASSPLASTRAASVLVAGCGTGSELLEARAQRPDWHLTAIDPSAILLEVARGRLEAAAPAIDWRCTRVEDLGVEAAFDGALSVLVLQSLPDDGSKLAFLSALARSLRPGGQLVLVDLMRPERSALQAQVERAWAQFQRASGEESGDPGALASRVEAPHPIGEARLAALAEASGFGDPAPVFKALDFEGFLLQRRS